MYNRGSRSQKHVCEYQDPIGSHEGSCLQLEAPECGKASQHADSLPQAWKTFPKFKILGWITKLGNDLVQIRHCAFRFAELLEALTSFRRLALGAKHRQIFDHKILTARHQNKIPPSATLNLALPPSTSPQFLPHTPNPTTSHPAQWTSQISCMSQAWTRESSRGTRIMERGQGISIYTSKSHLKLCPSV